MAEQSLKNSTNQTDQDSDLEQSSDSPLELVTLVEQSLQKHLELEAKYEQLEDFQCTSTDLLHQIIQKLDEQPKPDFEAFQNELTELRKDATSKISGLQTALTLNHEKQSELQADKDKLADQLDESHAEIQRLKNKIDDLEDRCASIQREMTVLQTAKQNVIDQRDELDRENKRLQDQLTELNDFARATPEEPRNENKPDAPPPETTDKTETDVAVTDVAVTDVAATDAAITDDTESAPKSAPKSAQTALAANDLNANSNQQFWESQKSELFKKYGLETQPDEDLHPVETETASDSAPNDDLDQPDEIAPTSISVIDEQDSLKSKNLSPIIPVVENPKDEPDEMARRREVELSLERARISRKRKALEDKIVALKSEMTTEKENKGGLLSRMKKFLSRDDSQEEVVEEMKGMLDKVGPVDTPTTPVYDDPRDHPFFKVDIDEVRRIAADKQSCTSDAETSDVVDTTDHLDDSTDTCFEIEQESDESALTENEICDLKSDATTKKTRKKKKSAPRSRTQKRVDDQSPDKRLENSSNDDSNDTSEPTTKKQESASAKKKSRNAKKPRRSRRRR